MNIYIVGGFIILLAVIVITALIFMNVNKSDKTTNDISKVKINEVNKVISNVTNTTTSNTTRNTTNTVEDSPNENNSV